MFVLLSGFTFAQTLDDAWRAGDIYLANEKQGKTSYEAKFSSWDIAGMILNFSMKRIQK